eukprot:3096210-Rhodomonas_salina.1
MSAFPPQTAAVPTEIPVFSLEIAAFPPETPQFRHNCCQRLRQECQRCRRASQCRDQRASRQHARQGHGPWMAAQAAGREAHLRRHERTNRARRLDVERSGRRERRKGSGLLDSVQREGFTVEGSGGECSRFRVQAATDLRA